MMPPHTAACRSPCGSLCRRRPNDSRPAQERRDDAWGRRPLVRGDLAIKSGKPNRRPPGLESCARSWLRGWAWCLSRNSTPSARAGRTSDEQRSGGFSASALVPRADGRAGPCLRQGCAAAARARRPSDYQTLCRAELSAQSVVAHHGPANPDGETVTITPW